MKDGQERERAPAVRVVRIKCRRIGEHVDPEEHERCPYCFGRLAEIEQGQHEAFCEYRPGVDPVRFGFPPGGDRDLHG